MFLIIYDEEMQNMVIDALNSSIIDIKKIYDAVKKWLEDIYLKDMDLPAKFASQVFMGGFWDYAMEVRVTPAIFQILVDIMNLPLWVSWADMELGGELIRLILLFSTFSKVEGIPGKVIVAQFSDDDRPIELTRNKKSVKTTTLLGGIAVLYVLKRYYLKQNFDIDELLNRFNTEVSNLVNQLLIEEKEIEGEESITDLEEELRKGLGELFE